MYILTFFKITVDIGHYIFSIPRTISMISYTNFSLYSYCCSNYCNMNRCRSFLLLKAIAKSKGKPIVIAFKSDCTIIHTYFLEKYSRHRPLYILYPAYNLHVFFHTNFPLYSYCSSNYCDSNSCRSFSILKAIAKSK